LEMGAENEELIILNSEFLVSFFGFDFDFIRCIFAV
jgi:hypothetical protein